MARPVSNAAAIVLGAGALVGLAIPLIAATPDESTGVKIVHVVDGEGKPIAGARVVPWAIRTQEGHGNWTTQGLGQSEPPELTTDADGQVVIAFPKFADKYQKEPVRALTCSADHPDYVESVFNEFYVTAEKLDDVATITLVSGDVVEVAALNGAQPLPIDDVYVQWSSDSHEGHNGTTLTEDGMRRLPRLPPGPELLRLVYLPADREPLFSVVDPVALTNGKRRKLRMQLHSGAYVVGRLDDAVPRPVKNGRVVGQLIDLCGAGKDQESLTWRTCATIREDGTFTLPPMPEGELQLIAMCDGFVAAAGEPPAFASARERGMGKSIYNRPQTFKVVSGANDAVTVAMTAAAAYEFHVTDQNGKPLASVDVGLSPNVGWWRGGSQIYCWPMRNTAESLKPPPDRPPLDWRDQPFRAVTDAQGIARVENVPLDERNFEAWGDDWIMEVKPAGAEPDHLDPKAGKMSVVDVMMQPRGQNAAE
jgi:hypothetical protein